MSKAHHYWTYIVTNYDRNVMYTGITNNLAQRLKEHYDNRGQGKTFAGHYYAYNLVYYEYTKYVNNAIYREKEIKNMSRQNKIAMITAVNPDWKFLNIEICGEWPPTYAARLQKEDTTPINDSDDEWWIGLIPPPI